MRDFIIFASLINPFNPLLVKTIVKPLWLFAFLCFSLPVFSQLNLSKTIGSFGADIKKIIREYPHQFGPLLGRVIRENPQTTEYECTQELSGAEEMFITRHSGGTKKVYSWQAVMLVTEDYEEAAKKYKSLYAQLNNMAVKIHTGVTFYLKGKYAAPTDEKRFSISPLAFEKPDQAISKLRMEVSMQYLFPEWKVSIKIFEQEKGDDEPAYIMEEPDIRY
ncbi:MAG TPA: hypothetical protein PKC69_09910 [Chitinophagaceae bacterium]|nr:hypothetical protein [Chitinophagaceae bacterium]